MIRKPTLPMAYLLLCALALFFVHTPPSLAAEKGADWSFSDDGTLTLNRTSGTNDRPFYDWERVKTLRLGPVVDGIFPWNDVQYFLPEQIQVSSKNPYYKVENGMLIDLRENMVVCTQADIVDAIVPNYITKIGERAFVRHTNLKMVTFPDGLLDIDSRAFEGCTSLKEIDLPDGLQRLDYAFMGCTGLTSVTIPAGAITLYAFDGCTSLTQAAFADGAVDIGMGTFSDCTALTDVHLPDSIRAIERFAFSDCTSLKTLHLPASLETIGTSAFIRCTSLETLRFPDGLKKIDNMAFKACTNLAIENFPEHAIIALDALPYNLLTPPPIPTPTSAPTPTPSSTPTRAPRLETPSPSVPTEHGSFGKSQLLLICFAVLIMANVAAVVVVVYKQKRRAGHQKVRELK